MRVVGLVGAAERPVKAATVHARLHISAMRGSRACRSTVAVSWTLSSYLASSVDRGSVVSGVPLLLLAQFAEAAGRSV